MFGTSAAPAIIAAMITPVLLIIACASLIATALVRLARVVDRVRKLSETPSLPLSMEELQSHQRRALLAARCVQIYFAAIVLFVIDGFSIALDHLLGNQLVWLPVLLTSIGMVLIVAGCAAMLAECALANQQIRREIAALITQAPRPSA